MVKAVDSPVSSLMVQLLILLHMPSMGANPDHIKQYSITIEDILELPPFVWYLTFDKRILENFLDCLHVTGIDTVSDESSIHPACLSE